MSGQNVCLEGCKITLVTFFFNVSSNGMTERMQSHTSCSSSTFPHCTFSKVSSNCLPERMHIRIGCIFGFSPLCLFKCLVKLFAWKDARSHRLHFLAFLQCVFSNVFSNGMTGRMQSHTSCICPIFLHCTFSKVASNCLLERRHNRIGCIFGCSPLCL